MDSESLCARVLRSRYYPNGEFLSAKIGPRPSYAWRSILFGRELLVKGLRRNIGSGESINVWTDKWLFVAEPVAPLRKQILFDLELRVCDLINAQTKTWDRGKLEELFFPSDIDRILKLKPAFGKVDSYEWVHNKWGAYSVKSGYWLACSLDQTEARAAALCKPSINDLRKKVWEVKTAPKIKIFMWKAMSNALAVSDELSARGMKVDPRCQRCGENGESINHVLFSCPAARVVWAISGFPFPPRGFEHHNLFENFEYLFSCGNDTKVPKEIGGAFPWILWTLWKNKNAFIFEGKEYEAAATVKKAFEESMRWFEAAENAKAEETSRNHRSSVRKGWRPPESGRVKCNVGVSWSKGTGMMGAAWLVRNSVSEPLLHSRRAFSGVPSLLEAKRLGLMWAVESMVSHKLQSVTFEVEATDLVGSVNRPKAWPAFRAYGEELRLSLSKISEWEVAVVTRNTNRGAFTIARSVTREKRIQSYVAQGSPSWLRSLLGNEGSNSNPV